MKTNPSFTSEYTTAESILRTPVVKTTDGLIAIDTLVREGENSKEVIARAYKIAYDIISLRGSNEVFFLTK